MKYFGFKFVDKIEQHAKIIFECKKLFFKMSEFKVENWSKPDSVNLPSELRIAKFAEARVNEIIALAEFIGQLNQNSSKFQSS